MWVHGAAIQQILFYSRARDPGAITINKPAKRRNSVVFKNPAIARFDLCGKVSPMAANGDEAIGGPLWFKDAIIYELHVKTFCDSDGDGMGDFRGLIEKLDHLQELGITAIWLLPFYPSPLRDDGYDIADYFDGNPNFGSLADFRAFLDAAHQRNLRVITELVINHTSDQNPWFQKSRRAAPGSPEREFYVWS